MSKKTTVSISEWAKHLRPFGKRRFWKKDRKARKLTRTTIASIIKE